MSSLIIRRLRSKSLNTPVTSFINGKFYSTSTNTESNPADDVIIPQRIHRGPTDILEAIASTVGRDPTAAHYKYHDDPFLIPMSSYKKRVYALSQESGRKAAIWVRQQNSELFVTRESDPPMRLKFPYVNADPIIEAYLPTPVYNEESEVTEQDLIDAMEKNFLDDAVLIYNLMEKKNPGSLSSETEQRFLEFLCFFNEKNPLPKELLEEKWFRQGGSTHQARIKSWKNNGLAMKIFSTMDNKTPAAYCAVLQGMCKFYQAETAYELYNECRSNKIPLNVNVYNGLLSVSGFLKDNAEMQWKLMEDILKDMKSENVSPDLGTLNAVVQSLSFMEPKFSQQICLKVLAEFVKECGIEPSLATWFHVLTIYYKDKSFKNNVLHQVLDSIEGQTFDIKDPNDTVFFMFAMTVCRMNLNDVQAAHRLHGCLLNGKNYDLIGDAYRENVYYRHYFSLICRNEPFDKLIETYDNLVPHVYVPESSVMEEILRAVDLNIAYEYYPLLWSHLQLFGMVVKQNLVQYLLQSMVRNIPPELIETNETKTESVKTQTNDTNQPKLKINLDEPYSLSELPIEESFSQVAWDIWEKVEERNQMKNTNKATTYWTAGMLSDIVFLLTKGKRFDDAHTVLRNMSKLEGVGVPSSPENLLYFAKLAVQNGRPSYSYTALKYLSNCGYPEATDAAFEILQTILNRPKTEIDHLVIQASLRGTENWTADTTVLNLVTLISQNKFEQTHIQSKDKSQDSSTSSDSSSNDDSTSSDSDEEDLKK